MTTEKKKLIRLIAFCAGVLLIVSLTVGTVLFKYSKAKYAVSDDIPYSAELQDFDVDCVLTYSDETGEHQVSSGELADTNGVLRLSKENYNSLRLDVRYTGEGKCYCRFRITESWQHKDGAGHDEITPKALSEYTFDERFFDNRSEDGFIYSREALKGDSFSIPAITACTAGEDALDLISPDDAAEFVDIAVEVDSVQWNQAEKLWGMTELPWERSE